MEKKPFVTLEQARAIIADVPTPFHLYDEAGIRERARAVNRAFSWNPGFREHFAVKATPNPYAAPDPEGGGLRRRLLELHRAPARARHAALPATRSCSPRTRRRRSTCSRPPGSGRSSTSTTSRMVDFLERVGGGPRDRVLPLQPRRGLRAGQRHHGQPRRGQVRHGRGPDGRGVRAAQGARRASNFGIHAFLASNTVTNDYYPALAAQLFELAVRVAHKAGRAHLRHQPLGRRGGRLPARAAGKRHRGHRGGRPRGVRPDPGARRHGRRRHPGRARPLHARALRLRW